MPEPPKIRWDLSVLFDSITDPRIEESWKVAHQRADELARTYRGKIMDPSLTAETLLEAIKSAENLSQDLDKPLHYANLLFAADSSDPKLGAFLADQSERGSAVRIKLMFLELELQAAPQSAIDRVLADPSLKPYTHFIQRCRMYSPHRLTEAEEVILEETSNTGSRAWVRFFEEVTANHVFKFVNPATGETEDLTEHEVISHLYSADRDMRVAAGASLNAGLKQLERPICFTYNNLLADKKVEDRLRKFDYAEQSRHMSNELDRSIVDLVVGLCKKNYGVVARYYQVKKKILGLNELTHVDRYAPLEEANETYEWDQAKQIVLDSFGRFSPVLRDRAAEFFDKGWIDAEPRTGKGGGAFCSYITPDTHPVILMSYMNRMKDVGTLAHELGHGVHASLSREQSYFNFNGTLPLAELASIFGEMLVFEQLTSKASDKDKVALYAEKIEGCFASVFRQVAMYSFEQRCHQKRREEGELAPSEFEDIWQDELQAMFGDSVKLGEEHRNWWSYVGHFFFAPFYVYAYAFGELLTMALYQRAKVEGPEFVEKYVSLLRLAGSESPEDLMKTVGVDLRSESFWQGGIDAIEGLVSTFEKLNEQHS